ncbi:MAG TPA: CBS domain-containing protein, partial [Gemmatimonadales bacterium]|nr:CBS domain-containing protein [Gemmatimonadales bacterium]
MELPGTLHGPDTPMRQVVVALAHGRGIAPIVSSAGLVGVITAGDLTRLAEQQADFGSIPAADVMSRKPRVARSGELAAAVVGRMEREAVIAVPVLDAAGAVIGVVHLHDLLRSGAA